MDDLISRQAAIDALGEKPLAWTEGEYELGLQNQWEHDVDAIRALPPVQPRPKTGHWISYWDEEARCYVYKCPECGNKQPFDTKCCWECGTRLIEPQESEAV